MKIKSDTQKMIIVERNTDSQVGSVLSISVGILFLYYFFFAKSIPIAGLDKNPGLLILLLGLFLIGVGISFLSKTEKIQTSLDKSTWTTVGTINSSYGNQVYMHKVTPSRAKYLKFNHNSYLGIGYCRIYKLKK